MHFPMQRVTVSLLTLVLALPARAGVLRVDAASPSAVEDGSVANPFKTIQPAINAAVAGDSVVVAPGLYYGAIELKSGVPLVGEQGPKVTVIDAMGAETAVAMPYVNGPDCSFQGFTVRNAGIGFFVWNRVNFWGGARLAVSNAIVSDVGLGFEAYPSSSTSFTKTLFTRVGRVVDAIWCAGPQFTNVTVDGATSPDGAFVMYQTSVGLTNTTVSSVAAVFGTWGHWGSGYVWGSNNNLWGYQTLLVPSWSGSYPYLALAGTLEANPLFVNAAAGDFQLSPGSPLVDAGVDVGLPYFGAAPDLGAYESGLTIEGAANALAESYAAVPLPAYKNAAEQRRHALTNKLVALLKQLGAIDPAAPAADRLAAYAEALAKLEDDIWAKADGFFGGNPKNDWITTPAEQAALEPKVAELRQLIQAEMARLQAN